MSGATMEENPPIVDRSDSLEAVRDVISDAATFSGSLWLSYIFVLFYLIVSVAGVTQEDLLFEYPVKLPFLNVPLPLVGFFFAGPPVFLIIHMYILVQISLLAEKVGIFNEKLRMEVLDPAKRTIIRRQLPNNIFVHFLAGPQEARKGVFGLLLGGIAWISLVVGPVWLLIFFQLQFLCFHSQLITWTQRLVVVLDIGLLWYLWPNATQAGLIGVRQNYKGYFTLACMVVISVVSLITVFVIATFPDEKLQATTFETNAQQFLPFSWAREHLVNGSFNSATGEPTSLWSDIIVLPDLHAIKGLASDSDSQPSDVASTFSPRGRDLEGAIFLDDDFQNVDFNGADLTGASFDYADLEGANFSRPLASSVASKNTSLTGYKQCSLLPCTILAGATFVSADLQGANFSGADLEGASFDAASLEGAILNGADLVGATLQGAELQGATFWYASLEGADLKYSQMQAASLWEADLKKANFEYAQLQGATFSSAHLENADLRHAHSEETFFDNASLAGADLEATQFQYSDLHHASFNSAKLKGADFEEAVLVSSTFTGADLQDADVKGATFRNGAPSLNEVAFGQMLQQVGCGSDGAPFVLRSLLSRLSSPELFSPGSAVPSHVASYFLEGVCAGNRGLNETEREQLEAIAKPLPG